MGSRLSGSRLISTGYLRLSGGTSGSSSPEEEATPDQTTSTDAVTYNAESISYDNQELTYGA